MHKDTTQIFRLSFMPLSARGHIASVQPCRVLPETILEDEALAAWLTWPQVQRLWFMSP